MRCSMNLISRQAPGTGPDSAFGLSPAQRLGPLAPGQKVPNGESSMWGDYHARELALLLAREAANEIYPTFFRRP